MLNTTCRKSGHSSALLNNLTFQLLESVFLLRKFLLTTGIILLMISIENMNKNITSGHL